LIHEIHTDLLSQYTEVADVYQVDTSDIRERLAQTHEHFIRRCVWFLYTSLQYSLLFNLLCAGSTSHHHP